MKLKGLYEIHALIGRCHLHNKKNSLYSITLKMGTKAVANTEYKMPTNDEINFNTELILKIDKVLFEGPGKLSIIVTMQSQQKERKIIGSAFANFRQKGLQSFRVSQCSCKDRGLDVNVEFEVVNIQNHNNNPHNNKFQSPNNSQMKDLKKALTISRQKQLVKSSRTKLSTGTKSPAQKTQSKLNKHKIEKQLKDQLSPDISNLTTKFTPHSIKFSEQTREIVAEMKDKIAGLEGSLRESSVREKMTRKQMIVVQSEVDMLRRENECLLQILTFEEEKSSAAIQYISFLTQKIGQKNLMNNQFHQYFQLIQTIKDNDHSDTSKAIRQHNALSKQAKEQYSFYDMKSIQQKEQISLDNTQKIMQQMEQYKGTIVELRQKIVDLEYDDVEKSDSLSFLQAELLRLEKQNNFLNTQIDKLDGLNKAFEFQLKSIQIQNNSLTSKNKQLQKMHDQMKVQQVKSVLEVKQISKLHNISIKQNAELKQKVVALQNKVKQYQNKYEQLKKQYDRSKAKERPATPSESQIIVKKSRFDDGDDIENIIKEMNDGVRGNKGKQLLLASRREDDQQGDHFLSRNKSQSLLNDLQQSEPQSASYQNKDQMTTKSSKKVSIPQHKKQVKQYNYEYDIDSLNYFNNFEENHERMETSGVEESNSCEVEVDLQGRA